MTTPIACAAATVAVTQAIGVVIAASRKMRASKEKLPLGEVGWSLLFNAGQLYIASLVAALCLSLGGVTAHSAITNTGAAFTVGAAVIMYRVDILLGSAAISLPALRPVLPSFLNTQSA